MKLYLDDYFRSFFPEQITLSWLHQLYVRVNLHARHIVPTFCFLQFMLSGFMGEMLMELPA